MAKATYSAPSGAVVVVEGTQEEVASVLRLVEGSSSPSGLPVAGEKAGLKGARATPMGLLSDLISRGFFSQPRDLGAVRATLQEAGHFYPATTLSPLMLRLVRRRELRRLKEKNRWLYVR